MATALRAADSRWVHGPASDLLLGGGLLYLPVLVLLVVAGSSVQSWVPLAFLPLLGLAFNTPHLGATLVRVYERPEDRRKYRLFAVHVTLAVALAFLVGLYVPVVGSLLVTFYLTIVPWHFTGQNYGIALVFLRRRGVQVDPAAKRWIYVSFLSSYGIALLGFHGGALSSDYSPLGSASGVYQFYSLGIPGDVQKYGLLVLGLLYFGALTEAWVRLRRSAPARDLMPAVALVLTQALWYSIPTLVLLAASADALGPLSPANHAYTFSFIAITHGVQYLWITTDFARKQRPATTQPRFLLKALLAGSAIYGIPVLLFAPDALGRLSHEAGLFLMVSGALNLHHVLLDGAIWKLRDGRIASILIHARSEQDAPAPVAARRRWLRPLVWASGVAGVVFTVVGVLESEYGYQRALARGDLSRLETAAERLFWIGRDESKLHLAIGTLRAERGDRAGAAEALERSIALQPTAAAWVNLGILRERGGDLEAARRAYDAAVETDPEHADALYHAGRTALRRGEAQRARALLAQALLAAPDRPEIQRIMERASARP